jgi:L-serine dehydratase
MDFISVFDMLKIGIGPSSSHTLGPWRAAERFVNELKTGGLLQRVHSLEVHLYGSLALTGKGHGTDIAILMGLSGKDPVTVPVEEVKTLPLFVQENRILRLGDEQAIRFNPEMDIHFHDYTMLHYHANGMRLHVFDEQGNPLRQGTFYSVGGGFVVKEGEENASKEDGPHGASKASCRFLTLSTKTSSASAAALRSTTAS